MRNSVLTLPVEPGPEVVSMKAALEANHDVFHGLRQADRLAAAPDLPAAPDDDHLHEICHDLRQPVASIIMLAEAALCQTPVQPEIREYLQQVREQALWMGDLVQHLMEPENNVTAIHEECDLARLVSDAVQVEKGTYTGELIVQRDSSNMHARGNRIEIRRTIANLLSNATRAAGPDGKVIVGLLRAGDRMVLTVDDSGPGFGRIRPGARRGLKIVAKSLRTCGGHIEHGRSQLGGVRASIVLHAASGRS